MPVWMTNERIIQAIDRLEQAVLTLETRTPALADTVETGTIRALQQRHDALRDSTAAAIRRLDSLLDSSGEG